MSKPVIQIENVSKLYQLGEVGTGTLSHDLNRAWAKLRGKPDPFAKVGLVNDREQKGGDFVWALKDINLEVQEGEILGIIGRNGAGKSTLLKLLSRVTAPTTGVIRTKGRIASLLEIGTGFHPELTGRENIYLNGAILGMTRREVTARLEEIVEFSGCTKYIDTPVKRYSSGMMVRLGFAVAAHLECEILIVDEVLAVGDADFQKKSIGKMQSVSRATGKTVFYVSHNLSTVSKLCQNGLLLEYGLAIAEGNISDVLLKYQATLNKLTKHDWEGSCGDHEIKILKTKVSQKNNNDMNIQTPIDINIVLKLLKDFDVDNFMLGFNIVNQWGAPIARFNVSDYVRQQAFAKGIYEFIYTIPPNFLATGFYQIKFDIGVAYHKKLSIDDCDLEFELISVNDYGDAYHCTNSPFYNSLVRAKIPLVFNKIQ